MTTDLSFEEVCKFIKEDSDDPQLIDAVDKMLGLVLIFSSIAVGPAIAPAWGLLGVKNELVKTGKSIFNKLTQKKDESFLDKQRRMEMAYCLICYTAFFEAVDKLFPEIEKTLGLKVSKKYPISRYAKKRLQSKRVKDNQSEDLDETGLSTYPIRLPHPIDSFNQQTEQILPLYDELATGFLSFLEGLDICESAKEATREEIVTKLETLPGLSMKFFKSQYFELAAKFEDFYVWSNLQEHDKTRSRIKELSDCLKNQIALVGEEKKAIDLGFNKLEEAIKSIPWQIGAEQADHVIKGLCKRYKARIEEPIIEDKYVPEKGKPALCYPKNSEIFIPQSFRVIRQTSKDQQLENEATWRGIETRKTLGSFLLSYMSSPYSAEAPLIILGHPGSGKSLLTKILAARLTPPLYYPIRVVLRGVDAENEIQGQIEERIKKDTGLDTNWANLSSQFLERSPLVILDGYDELLQASGKVFSNYLNKVQNFQRIEAIQGRPVRVIVTSRITLIDKADIPTGATIIRLEEFDENQGNKWVGIWNRANRSYFAQANVEAFELPTADKITPLSKQPLLLLMLALYDSDSNQLRKNEGMDRTILYNSLLLRFIERERMKDEEFRSQKRRDRDVEIDRDMQRLGVAAMGMFNRRTLHILADQLNKDLKFFKLERPVHESAGTPLSQADILLGGFFFVHESTSAQRRDIPGEQDVQSAFEFLHNTFGEFLTADFILRKVLNETKLLDALQQDEALKPQLIQRLDDPNGFLPDWFACLMFTPLYTRPVVLEMLREWAGHSLKSAKQNEEFLKNFDIIISNQIKRLLLNNNLPSIMGKDNQTPFEVMPLLGHIAIYSLNLILLRTVLCPDGYIFDEDLFNPHKGGTRPWDQLTYLWRSWFSLDSLGGLTAILTAKRKGSKIHLNSKKAFGVSSSNDRLDLILNVSIVLADNTTAGLAGLTAYDVFKDNRIELDDIGTRLNDENIDLELEILLKRLRQPRQRYENYRDQMKVMDEALYLAISMPKHKPSANIEVIRLAQEMWKRGVRGDRQRIIKHFSEEFFEPRIRPTQLGNPILLHHHNEIIDMSPELVIEVIQLARETGNSEWAKRLFEELFERIVYRWEILDMSPESVIEIIRMVRDTGNMNWAERLSEEFVERIIHPHEIIEMPPELIIEVVRLARETGNTGWTERLSEEFFERMIYHPQEIIEMPPELVIEVIRLARETGNSELAERLSEKVDLRQIKRDIGAFPLSLLKDILWLAEILGDVELLDEIKQLT